MAWQLVQLAERSAEYRSSTGGLVPRNEWRRWLAMFVHGDPQLGDPVVKKVQVRAFTVCMYSSDHRTCHAYECISTAGRSCGEESSGACLYGMVVQ